MGIEEIGMAREKILENIKLNSGEKTGIIKCPVCGNYLHYSMASNGHIHARCKTDGCLVWME